MNFSSSTIKKLAAKKYLNSVYRQVPSKIILDKCLPNIGATTLEINSNRHSIIVEPNVPVIQGKEAQHNQNEPYKKVMGVYEGVTVKDIVVYLAGSTPFKKIITTPESFSKVKEALELSRFNMYSDFFLLFDECERIIQDCSYRKNITLPLEDFFKFKKQAMISATPLAPSDPRFGKYKFKHVKIQPDFDYQQPLKLVISNSLITSLTKYISTHQSDNYFIFLNSTDVIASLIEALGIKDEASIYCAKESVYKLKINNFPNSHERLTDFKKYNFFTSRFFSAVDIKLDYKPTVIMLTDTAHAFHSILDPYTETIQILGRFRNGIEQAVHISTIDEVHTSKSPEEAKGYLEGSERAYNELRTLRKAATSPGAISTLDEALLRVEYAQFVNEDGSKNYFMWDNFINEERVKGYYISNTALTKAYQDCSHFKVIASEDCFPNIEVVINRLSKMTSPNLVCKKVAEALRDIYDVSNQYAAEDIIYTYKGLAKSFPKIVDAYDKLGYEVMESLNFDIYKIKKAIYQQERTEEKGNFEFLDQLALDFEEGSSYPTMIIIKVLRKIIEDLGLQLKPQIKLLAEFYDLSPRTTIARDRNRKDIKGYTILRKKFNSK